MTHDFWAQTTNQWERQETLWELNIVIRLNSTVLPGNKTIATLNRYMKEAIVFTTVIMSADQLNAQRSGWSVIVETSVLHLYAPNHYTDQSRP